MTPIQIYAHLPEMYRDMLYDPFEKQDQKLAKVYPHKIEELKALLFLAGAYDVNSRTPTKATEVIGTDSLSWILLVGSDYWGGNVVHLADLWWLLERGPDR